MTTALSLLKSLAKTRAICIALTRALKTQEHLCSSGSTYTKCTTSCHDLGLIISLLLHRSGLPTQAAVSLRNDVEIKTNTK